MNRDQRRRNLEEQRSRLEAERAEIENGMATASLDAMAEWTAKLERTERRIAEIDAELNALTGGDQQTQSYRRAVDNLNQWYGILQSRIYNVEKAVERVDQKVERLDQRLEHWIDNDAEERQTRQVQLDTVLGKMEALMQSSSADRRRNQTRIYWIVVGLFVLQIALAVGLYWWR